MRSNGDAMKNEFNRFDSTVRGANTDGVPIWFMRQAGRYLPEYREVRKKHTFDQMLADSALATEITLQPIRRFDLDAAVIFADIMTILQGLDIQFNFSSGGPTLDYDITQTSEREKLSAERLRDNEQKFAPFLDSIRNVRSALPPAKSVLGFAASPFTLLSYLIEGKTSKTHNQTRAFMAAQRELFDELMHRVAEATVAYLTLQIKAGASAVQIFESWGDVLSKEAYSEFVLPHIRRIVQNVQPLAPVIFYDKGASLHYADTIPFARETGAMLSVDWRIRLEEFSAIKVQGNLDPALLESTSDAVRRATSATLAARNNEPGYIFNLGHGITPEARLECVEAMVETVQAYR